MIQLKTPDQIALMREGGKKLGGILQTLLAKSTSGITLSFLEEEAQRLIKEAGGVPSFSTVEDYQWATCLCVNHEVVHGIPREYALNSGDLLTIDIGMIYKGFHTDTADTKIISSQSSLTLRSGQAAISDQTKKERFLDVGRNTLKKAIALARPGNRVGHISQCIEQEIKGAGYSVIRSLTGHGVGKELHEEPMIPGYLDRPLEQTPLLTAGMTIAIEVIYAMGKGSIVYENEDGWTLASKDRSLTAVFEHSLGILEDQTHVLTES